MRKYIRHPSDIPIAFDVKDIKLDKQCLKNISIGGVAVRTQQRVEIGRIVELGIDSVVPAFKASGRVAWCLKRCHSYDVGIQFVEPEDAFRVRMIEQICHIEQYKKDVLEQDGRCLSGEQAAAEWISKFASDFPALGGHCSGNG